MIKLNNKTKVGLLATAAIVVLIIGVNYLKGKNIFSRNIPLYAHYHSVARLTPSNPVIMYGTKVGQVDELTVTQGGRHNVLVRFHVYGNINVPNNTIARITSDLLGSTAIELVLDSAAGISNVLVQKNDTLRADIEQSITESINKAVAPVQQKVENLIASVDTIVSALNEVFTQETRRNLKTSFSSIRSTLQNVEHTTADLDAFVHGESTRMKSILTSIDLIANNIRQNNDVISRAINNFAAISDTVRALNLTKTVTEVNQTLTRVNSILSEVETGKGSLGKLLNDEGLYNNLQSASKNLDKLVLDLKLNPNRYFHFGLINVGGKQKSVTTEP